MQGIGTWYDPVLEQAGAESLVLAKWGLHFSKDAHWHPRMRCF
jgi:hypothetical protein